jgi:hypothetical protein
LKGSHRLPWRNTPRRSAFYIRYAHWGWFTVKRSFDSRALRRLEVLSSEATYANIIIIRLKVAII